MKSHWILLLTLSMFILAGCGQNQSPTSTPGETLPATPAESQKDATQPADLSTPEAVTPPKAGDTPSAPRQIVEKARVDLSKQTGVDASQIRIVEARAVNWPDAGLGCPQPDMMYAQVVTKGYWIVLEADGKKYPYHTDQGEQVILCTGDSVDPNSMPLLPANPDDIDDGQPWVPVK
jgi:hypothetical protein